jgi:hypothetical protein
MYSKGHMRELHGVLTVVFILFTLSVLFSFNNNNNVIFHGQKIIFRFQGTKKF